MLLLGILTLPPIFAWFTLRRGYSRDLRIGAFLNAAIALGVGMARLSMSAQPLP